MAQDYYAALEISKSASQDEIQKAYRTLARKYHPDLNPDDKSAQQKFKEVQQAHAVLSDPEKRKLYDKFGPDYERVAAGGPFPGGGSDGAGFGFEDLFGGASSSAGGSAGPGGFHFDGDLGDLFRRFGGGGGGRSRSQAPSRGRDLNADLTVPFNTSVLGGEASISVRRANKNESLTIKIPPGVQTGRKMRLRGQGEPGPGGNGDLIVELRVAEHPCFRRSEKNLELQLPVTIKEAVFGAKVDVPVPGGTVALKIPAGSNSGRRLRIKGQGVRNPEGEAGDLYVELVVKLPIGLDDDSGTDVQQAVETIDSLYRKPVRSDVVW